jgi:hypothetical protein
LLGDINSDTRTVKSKEPFQKNNGAVFVWRLANKSYPMNATIQTNMGWIQPSGQQTAFSTFENTQRKIDDHQCANRCLSATPTEPP